MELLDKQLLKYQEEYINAEQPAYVQEMVQQIITTEQQYISKHRAAGYSTGWPQLDRRIGGIHPRFYLIAGASSHGKTAWMLQMAKQMADKNDDVYCLYISLDDSFATVFPRVVASEVKIPSESINSPLLYEQELAVLAKRNQGIRWMLDRADRFKIIGQELADDSVEKIVALARQHKAELAAQGSKRKVVLFVDKFHDIKAENVRGDENETLKYIAKELKMLTTLDEIPVITTAELRKLNGNQRPTKSDVRETVKTEYTCDVIFMVYNEYAVRQQSAQVFHLDQNGEKQGVLEVAVAKNKVNGRLTKLFYELITDYCYLQEVPLEIEKKYASLIN